MTKQQRTEFIDFIEKARDYYHPGRNGFYEINKVEQYNPKITWGCLLIDQLPSLFPDRVQKSDYPMVFFAPIDGEWRIMPYYHILNEILFGLPDYESKQLFNPEESGQKKLAEITNIQLTPESSVIEVADQAIKLVEWFQL